MDKTDQKIIALLSENSRMTWKEIGSQVHKTGQAVGLRIQKLEDAGIIEKYTIKQVYIHTQFITVFMDTKQFQEFEAFVLCVSQVSEFHKISGDGCYILKTHFGSDELDAFLGRILLFGRYRVNQSIKNLRS